MFDIINFLLETGGIIMWPLAATSFLVWFLLIYRLLDLRLHNFSSDMDVLFLGRQLSMGEDIQTTSQFRNLQGIQLNLFEQLCQFPSQVLGKGLNSAIKECEKHILSDKSVVRTLIHIAPLLGLLGTVWGMIVTFQVLSVVGTSEPKLLAHGISQAMLTTQAGLLIAVPSIFVEKRATKKENWILHRIEENRLLLLQCFGNEKN